jgi:putative protease
MSADKNVRAPVEGPDALAQQMATARKLRAEAQYDLEMAFSRGLYTGWLGGINNQQLVHAHFGKKRGVYLGEVRRLQGERVVLRLAGPLKPGDGVVFDAGHPEEDEEGGRIYDLERRGREAVLGFGRGDINFHRVHPGDKLWKTSDPERERRLRQSFAGEEPHFQRPITLAVHGCAGRPLTLLARDELGHVAEAVSAMPLARAEKQPLSTARLQVQVGRLGGTPFRLGRLENRLEGEVILPISELNRLRREVAARLEALRAQPPRWQLTQQSPAWKIDQPAGRGAWSVERGSVEESRTLHALHAPRSSLSDAPEVSGSPGRLALPQLAEIIPLVRTLPQFEAVLNCGVQTLYCEFEDPKKYRDAVARFREHQRSTLNSQLSTLFVAPPRITKPGEEWILQQVRSCGADGCLLRNADHLAFFTEGRRIGDFSLNVANPLAAEYYRQRHGLERLTASYDLNLDQLEALLRQAPPEWFEVTIHQHMPMFHMEHCLFCAFLSQGADYTNCGRPCDKHALKLRDRVGAEHPVKADAGCRNTVFHALAQTGAEGVDRLLAAGVRHFRIEFLNETPELAVETLRHYRRLLRGEITGSQLWRQLKLLNQLGVTRGQLDKAERSG